MNHSDAIPESFGGSWTTFVDEWCLGTPPAEPSECARGLSALLTHLPEYVQSMLTAPTRGLGVIASALELGSILADTEGLSGVTSVIARLRHGERSAESELVVAATIARIGFTPRLEVQVGTKRPDLAVTVEHTPVYGEVISPDRAEAVRETTDRLGEIASAILAGCDNANIELFLDFDPERVDSALASKFIAVSPQISEPTELPEIGRFTKQPFVFPPAVAPSIDSRTSSTVMGVARGSVSGTGGTTVTVRAPIFDGRPRDY